MKLEALGKCISKEVYNMYQSIPPKEVESTNKLYGVSYKDFVDICNKYVQEEKEINPN